MSACKPQKAAEPATNSLLDKNTTVAAPPGESSLRLTRRRFLRLFSISILLSLLYIFLIRVSCPPEHPKPVYVRRIVAVGDLHGDYDNALKVLQMADVVDASGSWTGAVDYFVQTGDIIDRGVDTIKLFEWMERLREQAHNAGGALFSHMGNHEFMNVLADWNFVSQAEIDTFGSVAKRQAALSTGFLGEGWQQNYSVASRVPLYSSCGAPFADYNSSAHPSPFSHAALSFMHGGLSPAFTAKLGTPYPSRINKLGASFLERSRTRRPIPAPHPPANFSGLPPGTTVDEEALYEEDGPLWYRGWATDSEEAVCGKVGEVMQNIGVRRLIMGHTPDFEKIVSRCGGKIIIIDTGISKAYGGILSALSITYSLTPVISSFDASASPSLTLGLHMSRGFGAGTDSDPQSVSMSNVEIRQGRGWGKWLEREEVVAVYPGFKVQLVLDEREVEGDFW